MKKRKRREELPLNEEFDWNILSYSWGKFVAGAFLFLFGCYLLYEFNQFEQEGGEIFLPHFAINLYESFGKWGVVTPFWLLAATMVGFGIVQVKTGINYLLTGKS